MTTKYERQCWNCDSKNLEKLANHVKCRDCGATFNVVPEFKKASHGVTIYETKTLEIDGPC